MRNTHIDTVFLDRDGVINRKATDGGYITEWSHFDVLPGVGDAIARLTRAGVRVVVVTNQRAVARGLLDPAVLAQIHERMLAAISATGGHIEAVFTCEHDLNACTCRKPDVGLFMMAKQALPEIDFARSMVVGDSATDLIPGHTLGCGLVIVGDDKRRATELAELASRGIAVGVAAPSLKAAVDLMLDGRSER